AALSVKIAQLYDERLNSSRQSMEVAKGAHSLLPEDPQINRILGHLALKNKDYQWAASLLQEAARSMPNYLDMLYELAWSRYTLGQVQEAEVKMRLISEANGSEGVRRASGSISNKYSEAAKRFLELTEACKDPAALKLAAPQAEKLLKNEPDYV